MHGIK